MRYAYVVTIDTETGEAAAVEIPREIGQAVFVDHGRARSLAVECNGPGEHWEAARDALAAIMPEPSDASDAIEAKMQESRAEARESMFTDDISAETSSTQVAPGLRVTEVSDADLAAASPEYAAILRARKGQS